MKKTRLIATALMAFLVSTGAFAQTGDKAADGKKKFERPERETTEMKTERHKRVQFRIDSLNLMVKHGKMEKTKADFLIKKINNEKVFKDANPEWTKYQPRFFKAGPRNFGKKFNPRMNHRGPRNQGKGPWSGKCPKPSAKG